MIPRGVEIFVGARARSICAGASTACAGVVTERIGREARSGALFVFFGKRRDAIKVLFFDGSGLCLFYKRLDEGTFRLPEPVDGRRRASRSTSARSTTCSTASTSRRSTTEGATSAGALTTRALFSTMGIDRAIAGS